MATIEVESDTTLGDFVKCLVAKLHENKIQMPLKDERLWHCLFYELKRSAGGNLPFLASLRFDWDGPFPRSQKLSRFLHALHWNAGVAALNPHYSTIQLDSELAELWAQKSASLDVRAQEALETAFKQAQSAFPVTNR